MSFAGSATARSISNSFNLYAFIVFFIAFAIASYSSLGDLRANRMLSMSSQHASSDAAITL